jgi:hypothetical protein
MYTKLLQNLNGKRHLEDAGADRKIILEWILQKQGGKMWTGLIWLRIRASCGLF